MDKFCRSCGRETVPGNAFCSYCGGSLGRLGAVAGTMAAPSTMSVSGTAAAPGVDAGPAGFLTGQDFAVMAALMALALLLVLLLIVT